MVQLDALRSHTKWTVAAPGNDGRVEVVGIVGDTPNNGLREPESSNSRQREPVSRFDFGQSGGTASALVRWTGRSIPAKLPSSR
jgi:hypothetical protein